jgi:hypothetical protein
MRTCIGPLQNGFLRGCPKCNTPNHSIEQCWHIRKDQDFFHLVVASRTNRPPLELSFDYQLLLDFELRIFALGPSPLLCRTLADIERIGTHSTPKQKHCLVTLHGIIRTGCRLKWPIWAVCLLTSDLHHSRCNGGCQHKGRKELGQEALREPVAEDRFVIDVTVLCHLKQRQMKANTFTDTSQYLSQSNRKRLQMKPARSRRRKQTLSKAEQISGMPRPHEITP